MLSILYWKRLPVFFLGLSLLSLAFVTINNWPAAGAQAADGLREVIGNEGVAALETVFFQAQDTARQIEFRLGLEEASAPWQAAEQAPVVAAPATLTATAPPPVMIAVTQPAPVLVSAPGVAAENPAPIATATPSPTVTPLPTATATPTPWQPAAVSALGSLEGEGVWSPYLQNAAGETVAFRTYLQPDAERPFTVVAVVAFDLSQTRLHFVLGTEEPAVAGGPRGSGRIPAADLVGGALLAAFNGGFKAEHGNYGAMAGGVVALPPLAGLGTMALYDDGAVRIGEWGEDIDASPGLVAWRQNAPLVVKYGEMTEAAQRNSIVDWSGSIDGEVVTWRSGLGLSGDGRTLYYFAGPSLNMPALGRAMVATGVFQGMLLDINPSWVHFTAIRAGTEGPVAEVLLAEMKTHPDRFLRPYSRDFFYVTAVETEAAGDKGY